MSKKKNVHGKSWFEEKMEDPEYARLYEEEYQKLEAYYNQGTVVGVLAHPCNLYKKK
jgi:hypothetical protein